MVPILTSFFPWDVFIDNFKFSFYPTLITKKNIKKFNYIYLKYFVNQVTFRQEKFLNEYKFVYIFLIAYLCGFVDELSNGNSLCMLCGNLEKNKTKEYLVKRIINELSKNCIE